MSFYEELGVPPDAPQHTIREAYRNVARLLHPDAQTNPILKESAEAQMKRINHLYETLSDPQRRRRYDQELADPPERKAMVIIRAPAAAEQSTPDHRGTVAWLAATIIGAFLIIWLATREATPPVVYPQPLSAQNSGGAAAPTSSSPSALRRAADALLPKSAFERYRDEEIGRLRLELAAAYAERDRLARQLEVPLSERRFQSPPQSPPRGRAAISVPPPPAPLIAQIHPVEISLPATVLHMAPPTVVTRDVNKAKWSGSWTYYPAANNLGHQFLFPPEFIDAVISEDNGRLQGQYRARFRVNNTKISPDVEFRFEGRVDGGSGRFSWTGTGGAKGEVQLRLVSEHSLEVVWAATDLGKTMGLASGTAVLNLKK